MTPLQPLHRTVRFFFSLVCVCLFISSAAAQTTIQLKQNNLLLQYDQPVRLSTLLSDAYQQLDYFPYTLGTALYSPDKQQQVDSQKQAILDDLTYINNQASQYLAKQLIEIPFVFRENIEADLIKLETQPKLNPLIQSNHILSLPSRPDYILVIAPFKKSLIKLPLKVNSDLKDYLLELPNNQHADSAWVIQANGDVYQANDIQWQDKLYFLSPGAIIFLGLDALPDTYHDLNARIAHLLAFYTDI